MRLQYLVVLIALLGIYANAEISLQSEQGKDGMGCVACEAVVQLIQNEVAANEQKLVQWNADFCTLLPSPYAVICEDIIDMYGAAGIAELLKVASPDHVCHKLKLCSACGLSLTEGFTSGEDYHMDADIAFGARALSYVLKRELKQSLKEDHHYPANPVIDLDHDGFAPDHLGKRSSDWRGKDCNDLLKHVHPGAADTTVADSNCNGIHGVSVESGHPWETDLCDPTNMRSLAVFGDSAMAAFHIPPEWLDFKLDNLIKVVLDEVDYPQRSWSTGWNEQEIDTESVYYQMWANNRCNFRNYQNLGVNGGKMEDFAGQVAKLSISPSSPPLLSFVGYIGNDVCRDTLAEMTSVAEFTASFTAGLTALNAVAPPQSTLIALGLVDGRILWDTLDGKAHPLGIPMGDFYKFLSCTGANPCTTWLTEDAASRNATSVRAAELSQAIFTVAKAEEARSNADKQWPNLNIIPLEFPLEAAFALAAQKGIPDENLIEPVDGFHPSAVAHRLLAQVMWQSVLQGHPDLIGQVNPHNEKIAQLFGDQGGY